MRFLLAFAKKECTEQLRSVRFMILCILFAVLGIMNPVFTKLTPWLFEILSDALAESGMTVTVTQVSALDSWVQFFKNLPIGLIVFVILQSNIFTKEYGSGTLVLSLTKGLERFKVVIAKTAILAATWTVCYWLCFGITYGVNACLWDNAVAKSLGFSAFCWWLFGLWAVSLIVVFSTLLRSNIGVLLGTFGSVFLPYLLGLLPKINRYLPTFLMDGNSLIFGALSIKTYVAALLITVTLILANIAASIPIFNKKQI